MPIKISNLVITYPNQTKQKLLSISEFAYLKGVSRQAIWKAIKEKRIKAFKVGNQWIISKSEQIKVKNEG